MQILRHFSAAKSFINGSVVTIGNFDGVHKGHAALLEQLRALAETYQVPSVVILFEPQPLEVLRRDIAPARLTPLREKLQLLKQHHIDYVWCLPFTSHLAALSAGDFIEQYLVQQLHTKAILIGDDFHFGKDRQGDFSLLQALGKRYHYAVQKILTVVQNGKRISSTAIRAYLANGQLEEAISALGHPYTLSGKVRHGAGLGRQWGYPTANIQLPRCGFLLRGVFIVRVTGKHFYRQPAVANIGVRPTVDGTQIFLEVLLLNFSGELYGQRIEIEFLKKLRDEKKFVGIELLQAQIQKDIERTKDFFGL